MKFFILLVSLAYVTCTDIKEFATEFKALLKEVGTKCLSEVGATSDDLEAFLMKKEIPTKHEGMCLIMCMHKNFGIQNAEGKLDSEAATKSLSRLEEIDANVYEKAKSVFKTCFDKVENDADPCVTAANLAKCGKEEGEKIGLDNTYDV